MGSLLSTLLLGFVLGMRHATDADHVVAVATIVSRARTLRAAAPIGAVWGVGHTATILVVGGAIVAFGIVVPPRVGLTMELAVAVMLILLGGLNLSASMRGVPAAPPRETPAPGLVRPLAVGVVHGLAGSAAVALLVLGTIREPIPALGYLVVFGAGTIVGMLLITTALAMPFAYTLRRVGHLHRGLGVVSGVMSLGLGLFLVYDIGFAHGLFTNHAEWTPG